MKSSKRKTYLIVFSIICLFFVSSNVVFSSHETVKVLLNGEELIFDVQPIIIEGKTLVPFRAVLEAMDTPVEWDGNTQTVTAVSEDVNIILQIDNKTASVNGAEVQLEVAAKLINGKTMIPLRFISEELGKEVLWDESTSTVSILDKQNEKDGIAVAVIEEAVNKEIEAGLFPGAVIIAGTGQGIKYHGAFGKAMTIPDIKEMQKDSIFDLASATKVLAAATAIAICKEDGLIDYDRPFIEYLPEAKGKGIEEITVKQLATHTSGFGPGHFHDYYGMEGEELIEAILNDEPKHEPGTKYSYSCHNMIKLSLIVEKVTGMSFDEFCYERIYKKLEMNDTKFGPISGDLTRVVPTSMDTPGIINDNEARAAGKPVGNAGLFSTAEDISKFCEMMLLKGIRNGVRVMSEETLLEIVSNNTIAPISPSGIGWILYGNNSPEGLSDKTYGHSGWTGQGIWIDPENDIYVVVLTNRTHPVNKDSLYDENRKARSRIANVIVEQLLKEEN